MAQQIINIGTSPNDGTGDTVRDAFDKVNDNFTEVYDGLFVPIAGTDVGAPITGEVVFDEDVPATFLSSQAGTNDGTFINGYGIVVQAENNTSVLQSLETQHSVIGNTGSVVFHRYIYGDGQIIFRFPVLGATDDFTVNWPAKGGTVAMTSDVNAGTVTSVGLTAGTSGTDINVSGSPVTTSGSITLNIPTASATNRGALSSADWTTFNNKVSMLHSTGVQSATHTGTVATTLISSYLLAANSIADNQTIELEFKGSKTNTTSGSIDWLIFINSSASLSGATQISLYNTTSTTTIHSFTFRRRFFRRGGNLIGFVANTGLLTDYTLTNNALASTAVTFSSDQYLIIACRLGNSGQAVVLESAQITRI